MESGNGCIEGKVDSALRLRLEVVYLLSQSAFFICGNLNSFPVNEGKGSVEYVKTMLFTSKKCGNCL